MEQVAKRQKEGTVRLQPAPGKGARRLPEAPPCKVQWWERARFVLAERPQVENRNWCQEMDPRLVINCTNAAQEPFNYGFNDGVPKRDLNVCDETRRDRQLELLMPELVEALCQAGKIVVHCNQRFQRGPCGLMALCRTLLGVETKDTKKMILEK